MKPKKIIERKDSEMPTLCSEELLRGSKLNTTIKGISESPESEQQPTRKEGSLSSTIWISIMLILVVLLFVNYQTLLAQYLYQRGIRTLAKDSSNKEVLNKILSYGIAGEMACEKLALTNLGWQIREDVAFAIGRTIDEDKDPEGYLRCQKTLDRITDKLCDKITKKTANSDDFQLFYDIGLSRYLDCSTNSGLSFSIQSYSIEQEANLRVTDNGVVYSLPENLVPENQLPGFRVDESGFGIGGGVGGAYGSRFRREKRQTASKETVQRWIHQALENTQNIPKHQFRGWIYGLRREENYVNKDIAIATLTKSFSAKKLSALRYLRAMQLLNCEEKITVDIELAAFSDVNDNSLREAVLDYWLKTERQLGEKLSKKLTEYQQEYCQNKDSTHVTIVIFRLLFKMSADFQWLKGLLTTQINPNYRSWVDDHINSALDQIVKMKPAQSNNSGSPSTKDDLAKQLADFYWTKLETTKYSKPSFLRTAYLRSYLRKDKKMSKPVIQFVRREFSELNKSTDKQDLDELFCCLVTMGKELKAIRTELLAVQEKLPKKHKQVVRKIVAAIGD